MITTPLSLHVSDKQDSNLHHRPPRERTSPFGHYLHCTSFTVPPYTYPLDYRDPSVLALITPTLITILYLSSAILYILSSYATLFLFLLLFIALFYLSLLYLYHYISYTSILVIFTLFLYFYPLLFLSLFVFFLYYPLDSR